MIPENDEALEAQQDAEDAKEESQPISYTRLGSEDCPVDPSDESIEYSMSYRIPRIEGLEQCTQLTVSRSLNFIHDSHQLLKWSAATCMF